MTERKGTIPDLEKWEMKAMLSFKKEAWMVFKKNDQVWENYNLASLKSIEGKANYRLSWNGERFSGGSDYERMQTHRPDLLEQFMLWATKQPDFFHEPRKVNVNELDMDGYQRVGSIDEIECKLEVYKKNMDKNSMVYFRLVGNEIYFSIAWTGERFSNSQHVMELMQDEQLWNKFITIARLTGLFDTTTAKPKPKPVKKPKPAKRRARRGNRK